MFESHTVEDNIVLAHEGQRGAVFRAVPHARSRDETKRIDEILAPCASPPGAADLAANLVHGQKQWLEIGMLLAQDPKLLLVDEPVAGMTDAETEETASCSRKSPRRTR